MIHKLEELSLMAIDDHYEVCQEEFKFKNYLGFGEYRCTCGWHYLPSPDWTVVNGKLALGKDVR